MKSSVVEFSQSFNPLLEKAISGYQGMARSTAINDTYKKTISKFASRAMLEDEHLNLPSAMRRAVRELTEQGISTIDYKSGRQTRMDSAVRNAMTTEFTQVVQEVQRKLGEELGADGVEISAHEHCAVDHESLQGHTFTNEEYEKLQNGDDAKDIEGEAFQIDRPIGMWNCRHIAFPVIIGVSEPSFSPEELEELKEHNKEGIEYQGEHYTLYEAEQRQRRLETAMRHERETGILYKQVAEADDIFRSDYRKSRERSKALRAEYQELADVLKPKAVRAKWERASLPRRGFVNEISGTNVTKKDLMESAYKPINRFHVSEAGRAFQKHTDGKNRSGIFYGNQTGKATDNTIQGAYFVDKILMGKDIIVEQYDHVVYGPVIEIKLQSGMGAIWSADGKRFIGFRE